MLLLENEKNSRSLMHKLARLSIFLYIVSAISFEMTADTAHISTITIYLVFVVGLFFVLQRETRIVANQYVLLIGFFCLFVYMRNLAKDSSASMGLQISYWTLTCTILCLFTFWMSSKYNDILTVAMTAYIIGALVLSIRIVIAYGGIVEMINYASIEGENRVGGLLGNENAIGLFLANAILCGLIFLLKKSKKSVKVFVVVVMLVLGTILLLTGSRKSLAFVVIGVLFTLYFYYKNAKIDKRLLIVLILVLVGVLLWYVITTLPMFSTINERLNLLFDGIFGEGSSYESDQKREMMISEGLKAFYEKPLFGHGTGYSYKMFGTYSHNNFVELLMNYGVVGFALYYATYVVLIIKLWKFVIKRDLYAIYFFVYICVQILLGVGWVNYYDRPVQLVAAIAFGYLYSIKKAESKKEEYEIKESI